jgi:hypothetical protein
MNGVPGFARAPFSRDGMVGSWGGWNCACLRPRVLALARRHTFARRRTCLSCPRLSLVHTIAVCQEVVYSQTERGKT